MTVYRGLNERELDDLSMFDIWMRENLSMAIGERPGYPPLQLGRRSVAELLYANN